MDKLGKFFLVLAWIFLCFVLLTYPMAESQRVGITYWDKLVHIILFGVLTYLIINTLIAKNKKLFAIEFLSAFLISLLYAGLSEYLQIFIPGRNASELDFIAGFIGILLAEIYAYQRFIVKKK
jgi:polysaccharide biosynthesis protein VpsQ